MSDLRDCVLRAYSFFDRLVDYNIIEYYSIEDASKQNEKNAILKIIVKEKNSKRLLDGSLVIMGREGLTLDSFECNNETLLHTLTIKGWL